MVTPDRPPCQTARVAGPSGTSRGFGRAFSDRTAARRRPDRPGRRRHVVGSRPYHGARSAAGDWRSGSALRSHRRGHWFEPSIAHRRPAPQRKPSARARAHSSVIDARSRSGPTSRVAFAEVSAVFRIWSRWASQGTLGRRPGGRKQSIRGFYFHAFVLCCPRCCRGHSPCSCPGPGADRRRRGDPRSGSWRRARRRCSRSSSRRRLRRTSTRLPSAAGPLTSAGSSTR